MATRTWNHRILAWDLHEGVFFEVSEVRYENDIPCDYNSEIDISGDSIDDILWTCDMIKKACEKPILWGGTKFPQEYKPIEP